MSIKPESTAHLTTADKPRFEQEYEKMFDLEHIFSRIDENSRILDLGSGLKGSFFARKIKEKYPSIQIAGLEYDYKANLLGDDAANESADLLVAGNATQLPFADGSFDVVISGEITQDNLYFNDEENIKRMREEIDRVLGPQGNLVIFHEKEKIIPPVYKPVHEQLGFAEVPGTGIALTGAVYGVYEKENLNFGDIDSLIRVLADLAPEEHIVSENELFFTIGRYLMHGAMFVLEGSYEEEFLEEKELLQESFPEANLNIIDQLLNLDYSDLLISLDKVLNIPDGYDLYRSLFKPESDELKFRERNRLVVLRLLSRNKSYVLKALNLPEDTVLHNIGLEIFSNEEIEFNILDVQKEGVQGLPEYLKERVFERVSLGSVAVYYLLKVVADSDVLGLPQNLIDLIVNKIVFEESNDRLAHVLELIKFYQVDDETMEIIVDLTVQSKKPFYVSKLLDLSFQRLSYDQWLRLADFLIESDSDYYIKEIIEKMGEEFPSDILEKMRGSLL